jgi:hypothetical protein
MAGWIIREVIVGLMIGALLRSFLTALATAGEIVALQTTLAFAQTASPMQAQPGSTIGAFRCRLRTANSPSSSPNPDGSNTMPTKFGLRSKSSSPNSKQRSMPPAKPSLQ